MFFCVFLVFPLFSISDIKKQTNSRKKHVFAAKLFKKKPKNIREKIVFVTTWINKLFKKTKNQGKRLFSCIIYLEKTYFSLSYFGFLMSEIEMVFHGFIVVHYIVLKVYMAAPPSKIKTCRSWGGGADHTYIYIYIQYATYLV